MDDPFESAWLKWAGGVLESHVLADNVNTLRQQGNFKIPVSILAEYEAKRHCLVYTVAHIDPPFPPYWGVMLGNIVHNYRCSLDHIAWAIYKRGKTPNLSEVQERKVYFPITRSPSHFNNVLGEKLPGATRADIAKVRFVQPYRPGKRNVERHVLWVLDGLAQKDKHRAIHPVAAVPDSTVIEMGTPVDCVYRRLARLSPRIVIEPGAELARIYVKKTGRNPHIDVHPHFTVSPSIQPRLTLEEFLNKTSTALLRLLYEFSEPPPSIKPLLGGSPRRPK